MARKKFTLARFLLRPMAAFKRAHRIFKMIELKPVVNIEDTSGDKVEPGGFVVYNSVAFPAETWALIKPSLLKVDYKYTNNEKLWFIPEDQKLYTTTFTADQMTALHVAKRFERAA
jgi:hypothetical protein